MQDVLIIPSSEFIRQVKRLAKKYRSLKDDLTGLQQNLLKTPFLGSDLGNGKRKIRLGITSKGGGKRGGMRIITFNVIQTSDSITIYLITIYDKSEYQNVSDKYVDQIIKGLE